jgi:flagellar biosynthesis chaperone FliJ
VTNKIKSLLVRLRSGVSAKAMRTEAADTIEALHAQLTETRDLAEHWAILAEQRRVELVEVRQQLKDNFGYAINEELK